MHFDPQHAAGRRRSFERAMLGALVVTLGGTVGQVVFPYGFFHLVFHDITIAGLVAAVLVLLWHAGTLTFD